MRIHILPATGLFLALALSACVLVNPPSQQRKAALDNFMHALRWQRYAEAATHFTGEHRRNFLTRFEKIAKDLAYANLQLLNEELLEKLADLDRELARFRWREGQQNTLSRLSAEMRQVVVRHTKEATS